MKPFQLLVTIIASLFIISVILIILNDNILTKETVYEPDVILSIRDVDVKPVEVTSAKIRLNVTAYIDHAGGKTHNASVMIRAINSNNGLLETRVSAAIPDAPASSITKMFSAKSIEVSRQLEVDRMGEYELKLLIFDNGSIIESGSIRIKGLSAMTPQEKLTGINLNNIDFIITGTKDGNVAIRSDIYLENTGSGTSGNMDLVVKAREGSSNLLADKTTSQTGTIAPGETAVKSVVLTVPQNYNFIVAVELWRGNVLTKTWDKTVLLAPTKTVPKDSVEKTVNIEVSKFVREGSAPVTAQEARASYAESGGAPKAPAAGTLAVIAAFVFTYIVFRRRL